MSLYHKDVFLPRRIRESFLQLTRNGHGIQTLVASRHAENAAKTDRYGVIDLPSQMTFDTMEIVEIEHDGNKCVKAVIREVGQEKNRVFVLMPICLGQWLVKTVWWNLASDNHRTLNRSVYAKANI